MVQKFIEEALIWLRENVKVTDAEGNTLISINEDAFRNALMDKLKEKDVDLEKEIIKAAERFPEVSFAKLSRIAKRFYDLGCRHVAVLYDDIEFERQRRAGNEPEGLDEAAKKAADEVYTYTFQNIEDLIGLFKAGAKWMAEQGVVREGEVCGKPGHLNIRHSDKVEPPDRLTRILCDTDGFSIGDKVIVQIRKK